MLSAIRWQAHHLALFAAGTLICVSTGMLAAAAAGSSWLGLDRRDATFAAFAASTVFLHGGMLVWAALLLRWHAVRWGEFLGIRQADWRRHVWLGLGVGLAVVPLLLGLNHVLYLALKYLGSEPAQQITVQILLDTRGAIRRACFGVSAILLAPVAEEILFRGVLFSALRQIGYPRVALLVSSLFFAAIHGNLLTLVPLFLLALVLAWLVVRTDGLLASMTAHAVFNAVNFVLLIHETELTRLLERFGE